MTQPTRSRDEQTETLRSSKLCSSVTDRTVGGTGMDAWGTRDRSDGQLAAEAYRALIGTGRAPLLEVSVEVEKGTVILSGRVPTYYMKQLAQQVVLSLDGVEYLDNQVTVQ